MVFQLDEEEIWFPDPRLGDDDGCIAVGGDLSVRRLLLAYSHGIFPWYSFRLSDPAWFCPMQRFVIFPEEIHVSHSMRTLMNKGRYKMSFNKDFEGVINGCSQCNNRIDDERAWLGPEIIEAFTKLHELGFASSVEVWDGEQLVGGLYGVTIKKVFIGESMFSRVPSASKLALIYLATHLQKFGNCLIDCQLETPHLRSMGGRFIPYDEYMKWLKPKASETSEAPSPSLPEGRA
ncbi:MAG: leucyl/phenylalanyl-tRNA--protein transferase [Prevotella sp.]|nr:leucyl/phenylalanyl-tRNA--protein transferase [Prevotella sp.]